MCDFRRGHTIGDLTLDSSAIGDLTLDPWGGRKGRPYVTASPLTTPKKLP